MKLETNFVVYKKWKKKEIEARIQTLLEEVTAFGNIMSNQALWVNEDCDCIYVKSFFGFPSRGNKISCKEIPKVLTRWFRDIAESSLVDPDPDTIGDDGDESYANKTYTVTVEDSGMELFLRIRFTTREGEVDEEMFFIVAEADAND